MDKTHRGASALALGSGRRHTVKNEVKSEIEVHAPVSAACANGGGAMQGGVPVPVRGTPTIGTG